MVYREKNGHARDDLANQIIDFEDWQENRQNDRHDDGSHQHDK